MAFVYNKDALQDIENAFVRLKSNESDLNSCNKIGDALSRICGKTVRVSTVSPTSRNQSCSVMSVYPSESVLDKIIDAIVNNQQDAIIERIWNMNTEWNIEIDTRILGSDANLTEKELTALILHELGHITESNSVPSRISKVIRYQVAKTSGVNKELLKDTFFNKLLYIPLAHACAMNRNKSALRHEMQADAFAMKYSYGKELSSAIDKIMGYAGTDGNPDKELEELMGFSIDSLVNLQKRQNNIVRKNMMIMAAATPSHFAKGLVNKISNGLTGSKVVGASVNEAVKDEWIAKRISEITEAYLESDIFVESIFNRVHKMKRIDPAELDYIGIEVNNIKTNDDKMMVVSYIYSKLDIINYYISLLEQGDPRYSIPHTKESLNQMKERLEEYRFNAINKKLPELTYGINIQWPTGYEG